MADADFIQGLLNRLNNPDPAVRIDRGTFYLMVCKATFYSAYLSEWPMVYQKATEVVEKFSSD